MERLNRWATWVMNRLVIAPSGTVYLTEQVLAYRAEVASRPRR